ncbi:MAG: non-ribosomal peptide synthetase, partial [Methylococcales bacterium]|nr:non-ribosomal peptide synthetase [Methylococcales bacterium]
SALPDIVPMPAEQAIPLSFAQQRLWFIDQLMGGESTVYNMPLALRMQGKVNVNALQQSFSDLINRHDSLRMTFVTAKESGHAEQSGEVILLPAFEPLELKDLSDLSADKQTSTVQEQATSYLDQPFDLQSGPLFKARLLTLSEDEHVLLVNMHHIISDGWSMGVLIQDLTALYQSRLDNTVSTPSPLAIQYQDYAYWQRQWLSGEILEQQLAYWKQQLQGAPELLELPTDRARPAQQSYRGAAFKSRISRETLDKLNQLSQEQGVTLFMTLLTVFNVLLKRYSGQDDISVGSPIANRHQPGTESQVGFFVNTLVLRSQFEGIETFEDLLQQVRQTCLDAYSHQDVPFEQLVEELQPTRNMAINPLFQVMFALQNTPDGELSEEELGALADIELSALDKTDAGTQSRFDLTLSAAETEEGLSLNWEYSTDIFDEWRIDAMAKHFALLLEGLILKPEQSIEHTPLITAEQQQELISWNDTAVDYPKDQTIIDLFREQARQHPNNTAVVFEETQLSYQELDERSNQLARYLLSQ